MARIRDESVQAVRDGVDLVELVRGRVNLQRRGGRWTGRCPFHDERSPSFSLLPPDARRYYCHGCGATGDAFDWMQTQEGAGGFTEAVEALAERFGIDISYAEESPREASERAGRERRSQLLERAAAFYAEYLWRAADAAPAREYLAGRGIPEELVRRFRIGWAPAQGDRLADRAQRQGYRAQELADAGLARLRGSRAADFFVARITFPISDSRGRVQGFGARTLDPNERAKYVNSPEGAHFHKRHLLFGLAEARAAAAKSGSVVVVEGYTDVLAMVAAGVEASVACMGTSLTNEQLRLIARWAREVKLCFDNDAAGERAAWRSVEAARGVELSFSAVSLPDGRDPGDLITSPDGRELLAYSVSSAEPLLASLIRARVARAGRDARERDAALREITALLRNFPDDSVEKDEGVRVAAGLLQLSQGVEERLRRSSSRVATAPSAPAAAAVAAPVTPQEVRERRLLAMAVALPQAAAPYLAALSPDAFMVDDHRRAFIALSEGLADPDDWGPELAALGATLRAEASVGVASEAEIREVAYRLQLPMLRRRASDLRDAGRSEESLKVLAMARQVEATLRGDE